MWDLLPLDLLSHVFSFLPPDSLARATSACRHWHACAEVFVSGAGFPAQLHPPWFLALHTRDPAPICYGYNPILGRWHSLPLDFCPHPLRPIAAVGNLVLCRPPSASTLLLRLALCNPFAKHYRPLPELNVPRANPAVGVAVHHGGGAASSFQVFVAGGMSESGGYEPTVEMYDSRRTDDGWKLLGNMPWELAVRLTVWTQSESVYAGGMLYWVTSARAYSVMGYEVGTGRWVEVKAPEAERLGSAALVRRSGRLTLVGGTAARGASGSCCVWELGEGLRWDLVEVVPPELGRRFLEASPSPAGVQGRWDCTKCAGIDGAIYLYRDLASPMLVWRETESVNKWEWIWVEGFAKSSKVLMEDTTSTTSPIKGVLLHPSLSPPSFYRSLQDK